MIKHTALVWKKAISVRIVPWVVFLIKSFSDKSREKRGKLILKLLKPCEDRKILDLGSENGEYIASLIPYRKNVFIADISYKFLKELKTLFPEAKIIKEKFLFMTKSLIAVKSD